jgi:UPF0755 protein
MRRPRLPRRLSWRQVLAVIGVVAVVVLYASYRFGLQPAAGSGAAQEFRVKTGDNAPAIATRLKSAGLIRSRNAWITYVNLHGLRSRLKAGVFLLKPTDSGAEIAQALASGRVLTRHLVVPEGYRLTQIEDAAAAIGISKSNFEAALNAPHSQEFLAGKPGNVDLEGYLFPDSYEITEDTTAGTLVKAMLDNFGSRVGSEYVKAFAAKGLTLHQGLTIASIVEREVNIPSDKPIVAQIFLKRLGAGMPLGSEVTARYAAGLLGVPFTTNVNSPYNTLLRTGLPPGPICSPGLASLDAVAHPASTDYLYFITGRDHKDYFAHTYAEHEQNIAKFGLVGE